MEHIVELILAQSIALKYSTRVEVTNSDEHSSLLSIESITAVKKFYGYKHKGLYY